MKKWGRRVFAIQGGTQNEHTAAMRSQVKMNGNGVGGAIIFYFKFGGFNIFRCCCFLLLQKHFGLDIINSPEYLSFFQTKTTCIFFNFPLFNSYIFAFFTCILSRLYPSSYIDFMAWASMSVSTFAALSFVSFAGNLE